MTNDLPVYGVKPKSKRGFACLPRKKRLEIASLGGRSVAPEKRSFSQDVELARASGSRGGQSVSAESRSFSVNRELAAEAGRKGGLAKGRNHRKALEAAQ